MKRHHNLFLLAATACASTLLNSANGATMAISTLDGDGLDGSITEVTGSSPTYSGVGDFTSNRNFVFNNGSNRHQLAVFKFDLTSAGITGDSITNVDLTLHSALTESGRTRTVFLYSGDDSLITNTLTYAASNPFIDNSYLPETDTDTDFDLSVVSSLFTFDNTTANDPQPTAYGSGDAAFLSAIKTAVDGDGYLTLIVEGGNRLYGAYSDDDTDISRTKPTLNITYVPEPSSAALGILGMAGLFARRRRN